MRAAVRAIVVLLCLAAAPRAHAQNVAATIITLERGAMDRWAKGDPSGFLELMAPDAVRVPEPQGAAGRRQRSHPDL